MCKSESTLSNLRELVNNLVENNKRLMDAQRGEITGWNHAYEDYLCPWRDYLHDLMPQQLDWAFTNVKKLYTYDCTRSAVVEAIEAVISKINEHISTLLIEQCTQTITDAFSNVNSSADAIALATAIDEAKNQALAEYFKNNK
ncbi:MAG: hypothetical protein IJW20_06875 [Clostridia bacterium]|nr:hypothetical protein [Clostridia bacterium]